MLALHFGGPSQSFERDCDIIFSRPEVIFADSPLPRHIRSNAEIPVVHTPESLAYCSPNIEDGRRQLQVDEGCCYSTGHAGAQSTSAPIMSSVDIANTPYSF